MSISNEEEELEKARKLTSGQYVRKRLRSFHTFFNYFYLEQRELPWQFLIGPGPSEQTNYALTHIWYMFIISFIPVCSLLTGVGFLQPYFANDSSFCDWVHQKQSCESVIVLFVTYRIGFSVAMFFLFTTLILMRSSKDTSPTIKHQKTTSNLHSGFWIEKVLVVLVLSCVAFAFPTSYFDTIWMCFVLCGDNLLSCVEMFLLMDMAVATHNGLYARVVKGKKNSALRMLLTLFFEIFIPVSLIMVTGTLALYNAIRGMRTCKAGLVASIIVIVMLCCLITVVFIFKRINVLSSLYVCAYTMFLLYKAVIFRMNTCILQDTLSDDDIIPPNIKTLLSMLIMYTTCIYGLVRADNPTHHYYFYWVITSGTRTVDRTVYTQGRSTPMNRKPPCKNATKPTALRTNPNDTLLDITGETTNENKEHSEMDDSKNRVCYAEAFIHVFLLLVTLKSTSTVTNYHILKETFDSVVMVKPIVSSLVLYSTGFSVLLLYTWTVYTSIYMKNINTLSIKMLLQTLVTFIGSALYTIFIQPPKVFKSTVSKYVYTGLYFVCLVLSCISISPNFRRHVDPISFLCNRMTSFGLCMAEDPSYIRLYRFLATPSIFFLILAFLLHGINSTTSPRFIIQNGCWLLKVILLILIFLLLSNLPNQVGRIWLYISMVTVYLFTLLQLVCLLDLVGIINSSCHHTKRVSPTTIYYSTSSLTTFLYVISLAAFVCFYVYYAQTFHCKVTRLFISINIVLCVSSSLISIHPAVVAGGLLKSAIVTSWCMYLTWSALNYSPNESCNPLAHNLMMVEAKPSRDAMSITDIFFIILTLLYFMRRIEHITHYFTSLWPSFLFRCNENNDVNETLDHDVITTLNKNYQEYDAKFIENWLENCCEKNTNLKLSSTNLQERTFKDRLLFGDSTSHIASHLTDTPTRTARSHNLMLSYSYPMLHYVLSLSTCYTFVLLTHWLEPIPGSSFKITVHWSIMSVKMLASSTTVLLYIWTLVITVLRNLTST